MASVPIFCSYQNLLDFVGVLLVEVRAGAGAYLSESIGMFGSGVRSLDYRVSRSLLMAVPSNAYRVQGREDERLFGPTSIYR